jgi:hypothetical protein
LVEQHPEYFVSGTELDLSRAPKNYTWGKRKQGDRLLACGRDPYSPGWPDTPQLNYGNAALREAMIGELTRIAGQCDGLRCDMAVLVLPDVFQRTWGIAAQPFWTTATRRVRDARPGFTFMAEVYWDLEWALQQQGFDYTYDKRPYDRLREGHARPVREHFRAEMAYQDRLARFLEKLDEPRAAAAFAPGVHEAAAVVTILAPGLGFFHQGQSAARRSGFRPTSAAAPTSRPTRSWPSSTRGSSPSSASRPCGMAASGNCSTACRPGTATGRGNASWRSRGRGRTESDCWWS